MIWLSSIHSVDWSSFFQVIVQNAVVLPDILFPDLVHFLPCWRSSEAGSYLWVSAPKFPSFSKNILSCLALYLAFGGQKLPVLICSLYSCLIALPPKWITTRTALPCQQCQSHWPFWGQKTFPVVEGIIWGDLRRFHCLLHPKAFLAIASFIGSFKTTCSKVLSSLSLRLLQAHR